MYGASLAPLAPRIPRLRADAAGIAVTVMGFPSWRCGRAVPGTYRKEGRRPSLIQTGRELTRFARRPQAAHRGPLAGSPARAPSSFVKKRIHIAAVKLLTV